MQIQITTEALELVFRTLLSCKCPLTADEERTVFDQVKTARNAGILDFRGLLDIFKPNSNTVFHRLLDFCVWNLPPGADRLVIKKDQVLRHFSCSYHWNIVVVNGLPSSYKEILSIPEWLMGHMLLPVRLVKTDERTSGRYVYPGGEIALQNLFLPGDINVSTSDTTAVHFASVLSPLTTEEAHLVHRMLDLNPMFVQFRQRTRQIDYTSFGLCGNYHELCRTRFLQYY